MHAPAASSFEGAAPGVTDPWEASDPWMSLKRAANEPLHPINAERLLDPNRRPRWFKDRTQLEQQALLVAALRS
eukprot:5513331-Lingulodinium_polyedra.AAC.1